MKHKKTYQTEAGMVRVIVPESVKTRAGAMAKGMHKKYLHRSNSIRSGAGHYYAKIGEIIVAERYGWEHCDTIDTDTVCYVDGQQHRVEIKVKQRTVRPRKSFLASLAAANTKQDCTHYLFCSTIDDKELFIIGIIPKLEFMDRAKFYRKGEVDPDSPGKWRFRADCYNLPYHTLRQIGRMPLE